MCFGKLQKVQDRPGEVPRKNAWNGALERSSYAYANAKLENTTVIHQYQ